MTQIKTDDGLFCPSPVKPKFKTSNSDAVHANCIFKLKIRGLDLDGSILILAMSVCQFPIWHRPLPRLVGGVRTEGQKGRMGRGSQQGKPDRKATLDCLASATAVGPPSGSIGTGRKKKVGAHRRCHLGRTQDVSSCRRGGPGRPAKAPSDEAWLPLRRW